MNLDKYLQAWNADSKQMQVTIDTDALSKEVQLGSQNFRSVIFWRDVREAGIALILIPIWFVLGFALSLPWSWYLTVAALIWVAGFILVDRRRHPQQPSEPGEPLLHYATESLNQVEHQIWLLQNVFWWYLLPFCISIMTFFLQVSWNSADGWWGFVVMASFFGSFLFAIYWGIYRLNQRAVREHLAPRRQDLSQLIASLEENADSKESGDIMELVASVSAPICDPGLNLSWAESWNQIIPTWREVGWILLPTVTGASLGFASGHWLRVPEMGPTLFQTIVAAVIPFEIALGWVWWRFHNRQRSQADEASTGVARRREDAADSNHAKPNRLPSAPALVVLALILLLSIMAMVAIAAFVTHLRDRLGSSQSHRFSEPRFAEVGNMHEDDFAQVDAWLEAQLQNAKYPSLTVAIVREGELIYSRAFGFEDVSSETKATLQTRYHVASVTKVFTASLAVVLHEQGVLNLDSPVADFLPDNVSISTTPEVGNKITFRQLASHTSGLPRGVPGRVQTTEGWYELEPQRLYDHLSNVSLESLPGTQEEYSNLGFGLLGHALELATEKPLDRLLSDLICQPLQLETTTIPVDGAQHVATGYDESGDHRVSTHSVRQRLAGSGGLVSSVEDLTRFLAAQMKPGVFSREMLATLHTRTRLNDGAMTGTALGWSIGRDIYLGRILEKNGGRSNASAWIGFAPEANVGVAVVTNCGGPKVDRIGRWLLSRSGDGAFRPAAKYGYAKVAAYTGVKWQQDCPIVRIDDRWCQVVSINQIPIDQIIRFANTRYGDQARQRFAEDLVELLSEMGHPPDWTVSVEWESPQGTMKSQEILMTEANRDRARQYHKESQ